MSSQFLSVHSQEDNGVTTLASVPAGTSGASIDLGEIQLLNSFDFEIAYKVILAISLQAA